MADLRGTTNPNNTNCTLILSLHRNNGDLILQHYEFELDTISNRLLFPEQGDGAGDDGERQRDDDAGGPECGA